MVFKDRVSRYPNRWTMKKQSGESEVVTLIRNDEPIEEGTPMNATTLNELSVVAGAINAKEAAEAARDEANLSAAAAAKSEKASADSERNAKVSETKSAASAEEAKKAAEEAGAKASTDKTLSIENAPADAKVTGDVTSWIHSMLITGQVQYHIATDQGGFICTSDGDGLVATKQLQFL